MGALIVQSGEDRRDGEFRCLEWRVDGLVHLLVLSGALELWCFRWTDRREPQSRATQRYVGLLGSRGMVWS